MLWKFLWKAQQIEFAIETPEGAKESVKVGKLR